MHRFLMLAQVAIFALTFGVTATAATETATHRVAIHVDQNDAATMNMALNNAQNIDAYYKVKGETVQIEIVAYGPGLNMFVADASPVAPRIEQMSLAMDNIGFAACGNTHRKMSEKAGKEIVLMSEARMVPSGVVHLIELQEQGWSYIRP